MVQDSGNYGRTPPAVIAILLLILCAANVLGLPLTQYSYDTRTSCLTSFGSYRQTSTLPLVGALVLRTSRPTSAVAEFARILDFLRRCYDEVSRSTMVVQCASYDSYRLHIHTHTHTSLCFPESQQHEQQHSHHVSQ